MHVGIAGKEIRQPGGVLSNDGHAERARALDPRDRLVVDRERVGWGLNSSAQDRIAAAWNRQHLAHRLSGPPLNLPIDDVRPAAVDRQVNRLRRLGIVCDLEVRLAGLVSRQRWADVERGNRHVAGTLEYGMDDERSRIAGSASRLPTEAPVEHPL